MEERNTVFLTPGEALQAVIADLRQYAPQVMIICEVLRLVRGDAGVIRRSSEKIGAWVRVAGRREMQWMAGPDLVEHLCRALSCMNPDPNLLSQICSRIFQTNAVPARNPQTGDVGIQMETGMEDFSCRQCGRCCRALDYRDALSAADVKQWERLGRTDVLEWVGIFRKGTDRESYRMWVDPETREPVSECPFLAKYPDRNQWYCRIQDVKPEICRQYPFSRKHARMTGCPGFNKE